MDKIRIALAGNPNVGKSTLFNRWTGMRQHVGNWPGKTVEKKEGTFKYKGQEIEVVDLPGNYSLTAYSVEEVVSRDYIVDEKPDVIVNVIDAANIERNLYLTVQMMELGANLVLALNMNKFAREKGLKINKKQLSQLLGVPVIEIEAVDDTGSEELLKNIVKSSQVPNIVLDRLEYGNEVSEHIQEIQEILDEDVPGLDAPSSWIALKLLEDDPEITKKIEESGNGQRVLKNVKKMQRHFNDVFGDDADAAITDARYGFIAGLVSESVKKPKIDKVTRSDMIDRIVTHKYLGIPIFLLIMWLTFQITFTLGDPLGGYIEEAFGWLGSTVAANMGEGFLTSFIVDGIIGGVGGVLVFVPLIFILFLVLSVLEDSGYLARAAFVMDRFMHKLVGLHGKSFIPMILGFGCAVPGIMATRTLENERDRLLTMLIVPFMSCSARLPVYALIVAAFFSAYQGWVIFSLYLLGIVVAIIVAAIFKKTIFKGMSAPFVMELPPYRIPTVKGALIHMWERGVLFLKKAGTVILALSVVIWALSSLPVGVEYASQDSITGQIGTTLAPVFAPLGFGEWQATVAIIYGFMAKEVVVSTFGILYGIGEDSGGEATAEEAAPDEQVSSETSEGSSIEAAPAEEEAAPEEDPGFIAVMQELFTPLSAYAYMVFVLLYIPCLATLATIRRETNSWKWPGFAAVYTFGVAYVVSLVVYQGGLLLGFA
ncbi:ferrous iron transport protein B [Methanobacterium formicicum]|jgi:ferrous iron transport protein B|uniref:Ferrous iron transport protein B n=1 Tax=Methanobacterium formicicum TaxID=2162 RepID=A0A089ZIJ2_METFO|nr:ferrous iron transport protein B [Methanobacterium formicicum]AIS32518.1 ferrous iron transport protein B FeoB2 [Methanobacterium formicicum]CEL24292.1 ferrous iron transport protein B, FeoB [Methanobacterium formicicum]